MASQHDDSIVVPVIFLAPYLYNCMVDHSMVDHSMVDHSMVDHLGIARSLLLILNPIC